MPYMRAINSNTPHNNGGVVAYGGNVSANNTAITRVGTFSDYSRTGGYGSRVPAPNSDATIAAGTDTSTPTYQPYSAGNFAKMVAGQYLGIQISKYMAGVANTILLSGAADFSRKPFSSKDGKYTTFVSGWSVAQGSDDGPLVWTFTEANKNANFWQDDAVSVSKAVPGSMVFLEDGKTPEIRNYGPRGA